MVDAIHLLRVLTRTMQQVIRTLSTSSRTSSNHYDVLGITPKATQSDIKSAYYKLSKLYHPDKSSDETSAKKFRAISEAYEVLGNVRLKKMYDKGLIVGKTNTTRMEYGVEPEPTDPTVKFYKSRENRNVAPTMHGRTPIYDFDTWAKLHYGDLLEKKKYEQELIRKKKIKQRQTVQSDNQEALIYLIFAVGVLFLMLVTHEKEDYDKNRIETKNKQQEDSNVVQVK